MACRILRNETYNEACFYDSVTMTAFGPVVDCNELEEFQEWLKDDPRGYTSSALWDKFCEFRKTWEEENGEV